MVLHRNNIYYRQMLSYRTIIIICDQIFDREQKSYTLRRVYKG